MKQAYALLAAAATGLACAETPVAVQLHESRDGIGHILIVPYYTTQSGNATLLNIINTDRTNGKAIKIRFRGASNADDLFNFTLFLSPNDVWAAELSQNPSTGLTRLSTQDESCTLPTLINKDVGTTRLNPVLDVANESREGYIEIISMADIMPGTDLHTATTPVNGNLPTKCSQGSPAPISLQALLTETGIKNAGFGAPTTGLFANWSIFNVTEATSWAGPATAIVAVDANGVAGKANVVVHPQALGSPSSTAMELTSDPILRSPGFAIQHTDFPDLSTPYIGSNTSIQQASMISAALAKTSAKNEYFIDKRVQASTDWVFTLPTRRYSVAVDYAKSQAVFTKLSPDYFNASNSEFLDSGNPLHSRVCTTKVFFEFSNRSGKSWNNTAGGAVAPPGASWILICGAAHVLSMGDGVVPTVSPLYATVNNDGLEQWFNDFEGWGEIRMAGAGGDGLPLSGIAFSKAISTNIGAGISGNFGLTWPHRYTRPSRN